MSGLCRLTLVSTTMFRDNDTSSKCKTLIDIACGSTVQMSEGPVSKARSWLRFQPHGPRESRGPPRLARLVSFPPLPVAYQAHSLATLMVIPSTYTLHCVPSRSIASKCLIRSPLVCNRLLAVINLFVSIHYST